MEETVVSWLGKLEKAQAEIAARSTDHPWKLRLQRVRGKVDYDGLERVSTQTLLDILEVPQNRRTAGTYRIVSRLMAELGWMPVRVRALTRGAYLEQVRGYCRHARNEHRSNMSDRNRTPAHDLGDRISNSSQTRSEKTGHHVPRIFD
jgi:hypothetical protein